MQLPRFHFDPDTVALLGEVCDEAWREVRDTFFFPTVADGDEVHHMMAERVLTAAALGERNPQRLQAIALASIDG